MAGLGDTLEVDSCTERAIVGLGLPHDAWRTKSVEVSLMKRDQFHLRWKARGDLECDNQSSTCTFGRPRGAVHELPETLQTSTFQ